MTQLKSTSDSLAQLKVALIGCGRMAQNHIPKILELVPRERIIICDTNSFNLNMVSELFDIKNVYHDALKMLEEEKPDVVHLVTPPGTHKALALLCFERGANVYIEKPFCLHEDEADEIIAAAHKSQLGVAVGHQRVYSELYQCARQAIDSQALGRIIHLEGYDSIKYLERESLGTANLWADKIKGGIYTDLIPHILSIFLELTPDLQCEQARTVKDGQGRDEELLAGFYGPQSTATAGMRISQRTDLLQSYITIECARGLIIIDYRNDTCQVLHRGGGPDILVRMSFGFKRALKSLFSHVGSIFGFMFGRKDPYSALGKVFQEFYLAVAAGNAGRKFNGVKDREVVRLTRMVVDQAWPEPDERPSAPARPKLSLDGRSEVLVTGAGGFVGQRVVRRLLAQGKKVRALCRVRPQDSQALFGDQGGLEIVAGSVTDPEFTRQCCRGIETVYHLAAGMKGDYYNQLDGTCQGTAVVLEAIAAEKVSRLVYISTISLLDQTNFPSKGLVPEQFPYEQQPIYRGAYTYTKLIAEKLVLRFLRENDLKAVIVRPGLVWGPGKEQWMVVPGKTVGGFCLAFGPKSKPLPLIHVDNLADALVLAGEVPDQRAEPYTLVDNELVTQGQYSRALRQACPQSPRIVFIPIKFALASAWLGERMIRLLMNRDMRIHYMFKARDNCAQMDSQRFRRDFAWQSQVTFQEGIRQAPCPR